MATKPPTRLIRSLNPRETLCFATKHQGSHMFPPFSPDPCSSIPTTQTVDPLRVPTRRPELSVGHLAQTFFPDEKTTVAMLYNIFRHTKICIIRMRGCNCADIILARSFWGDRIQTITIYGITFFNLGI